MNRSLAKPSRSPSLWLITATIAIVVAGLSGVASAVNPHRPIITNIAPDFGSISGTVVTFEDQ
jgi:hypothetical protein